MPKPPPNPTFPHTVLCDTREQIPFAFDRIPADLEFGGGTWRINTERVALPSGDYSIDGYASAFAIERKSVADLFGTVGHGRDRFIRELERLNEMEFAAVVVEGQWSEIIDDPPLHCRMSPRVIFRSVLAWQQRFTRVHWLMMPSRADAEVAAFRVMERFVKERADVAFRKPNGAGVRR